MELQRVRHPLEPVFDSRSRVLLLGTMPSPQSRAMGFYYAHPRNRFWPVMGRIFGEPVPETAEDRRRFCLKHGVALWDVLSSCVICGAGDGSIRQPRPNPVEIVLEAAPVRAVFTTGRKAYELYNRYCLPRTGMRAISLPSTSPANCAVSLEQLTTAYGAILPYCLEERE